MPPPTAQEILNEIKPLGSESYKKILLNHGIPEPLYGVKIEHLKKIQRRSPMAALRPRSEMAP